MAAAPSTTVRAAAAPRRRAAALRRQPVVYFVALVLIALMLAPGRSTSSSAASARTREITVDPSGLPDPVAAGTNYARRAGGRRVLERRWSTRRSSPSRRPCGVVVLGLMASFVLAATSSAAAARMYALFAAGLMFPMTVAITPLYILVRNLGLMNSLAGVILPQIAFALPTTIIILVPFLRAIPERDPGGRRRSTAAAGSASSGGWCSRWRCPGVITVGILAFIGSWNSYLLPLFILNNEAHFTLPLGVQAFASQYSVDTAKVLAFTSLSMIPALVFFSLFERRIVGGLTGAVKG